MTTVSENENDMKLIKQHHRIFTPKFYFFLWCGCITSQSMLVSGFMNVVLSTIQVEFQMSSAKAAMFPSNYDIAVAVTVLIVAHFGSTHKPRTLGVGMILLAAGSFLFALPHFIYGNDNVVEAESESDRYHLCKENAEALENTNCDDDDEAIGNPRAYGILTIGSILIGLGASPVYTAGTTFCDEIFPPEKVSIYFGISYGIGAVAPAVGFILAGLFLGMYKTLGDPPAGLTADNANWVGAWWVGFLICALLGFIFGTLLLLFPAQLPECEEVRKKKLSLNIQISNKAERKQTFVDLLKEMIPLLKNVLTNPVFVLVVLGSITDSMVISAFAAWLPKMVESQFGVSSSVASYLTGGVIVPGAAGGIIISGIIVKWRKLSGLQCAKWQAFIGVVCCIVQLSLIIHCPSLKIDGFTQDKNAQCSAAQTATCPSSCPGTEVYQPVCIQDTTYTSPCMAACSDYNGTHFSDCCGSTTIATEGSCDSQCKWLIPYAICLLFVMFFTFLNNVIFLTVNLRCVKDSERVMAISLQSVAFRVFGSFPGPIILGAFIDKACILWNTNKCGDRGACQEYNNTELMTAAVSMAMIAKIIGTILYFIGWRVWARKEATLSIPYSDDVEVVTNINNSNVVVVDAGHDGSVATTNDTNGALSNSSL